MQQNITKRSQESYQLTTSRDTYGLSPVAKSVSNNESGNVKKSRSYPSFTDPSKGPLCAAGEEDVGFLSTGNLSSSRERLKMERASRKA